ncbi:MAG TPA: hypothetical protein VEG32_15485, partial [Clostridia bacterium]|nr:hypothetical protein [Clostridia bacterium]
GLASLGQFIHVEQSMRWTYTAGVESETPKSRYERNLPEWMDVVWWGVSPFALLFSGRIAWELTVLTWTRGPQAVGFALFHGYAGFAILGLISSYILMLWLCIALLFWIIRRKRMTRPELVMLACAMLVAVVLLIPH